MKVASSLKTLKTRDRNCQIVRRRGRLYVINKKNPRLKARQGSLVLALLSDAVAYSLGRIPAGLPAVFCGLLKFDPTSDKLSPN